MGEPKEGSLELHHNNVRDFLNKEILSFLEAEVEKEKKSKDDAYHERNMMVAALTKLFPSYLARHDENDKEWERDWMWIVYIELPTGQVSWHIHDSERDLFNHLEVKENKWDGHNTKRKYERLLALTDLATRIEKE